MLPLTIVMPLRQEVVVAIPDVSESRRLASWLDAEGFKTTQRSTARGASDEIASQPFDLLIVDCSFVLSGGVRGIGLARFRETPVIVIGDAAGGRSCAAFGTQIMFLERPVDRATFVCTVTMALMDSRPERRSPRRSVSPFEATVNGVRSHIIDVSTEGVRLEIPRDGRMVTPQFVMRVPILGVNVTVHRMWVRTSRADEQRDIMWCGGQLGQNTAMAQQGWRMFIDTLVPAASPSLEA
jgi:hypothetical protein